MNINPTSNQNQSGGRSALNQSNEESNQGSSSGRGLFHDFVLPINSSPDEGRASSQHRYSLCTLTPDDNSFEENMLAFFNSLKNSSQFGIHIFKKTPRETFFEAIKKGQGAESTAFSTIAECMKQSADSSPWIFLEDCIFVEEFLEEGLDLEIPSSSFTLTLKEFEAFLIKSFGRILSDPNSLSKEDLIQFKHFLMKPICLYKNSQGVEKRMAPYEIFLKSTSEEAKTLLKPFSIFMLPYLPLAALFDHRLDLVLPEVAGWKKEEKENEQETLLHAICRKGSLDQWKQIENLFAQNRFEMDQSILDLNGHSPLFLLLNRPDGDDKQITEFFTHIVQSPFFNPNLCLNRQEGLGVAGYLLKRLIKHSTGQREINHFIFTLLEALIAHSSRVNWNAQHPKGGILFLLLDQVNAQSLGLFRNPHQARKEVIRLLELIPRAHINLFLKNRWGLRVIDELLALLSYNLKLPKDFYTTLYHRDEEKMLREIFVPKKLTREEFYSLNQAKIHLYYRYSCMTRCLSNGAHLDMIPHLPKPVELGSSQLLACLIDPKFRGSLLNQIEYLSQENIRLLAGYMQHLLSPQELKRVLAKLAESNLPASVAFLSQLTPETKENMGLQHLAMWKDLSLWRQWLQDIENKAKQHDESYVGSLGILLDFWFEFVPLQTCLSEEKQSRQQEEGLNQLKQELRQLFESKLDSLLQASFEIYQEKLSNIKSKAASFTEGLEAFSEEERLFRLKQLKADSLSFYQALSQWEKFDKMFENKNSSVVSERTRLSAAAQLTTHRSLLKTMHQEASSLYESCSSACQIALSKQQEDEDQLADQDAPQLISNLLIQLRLPSFEDFFGLPFQTLWSVGIYEGRDLQVLGWNDRLVKACSPFSQEEALSSIQKNSAWWERQIGFKNLTGEEKELWKEAKLYESSLKCGEFGLPSASEKKVKTNNHVDESWAKEQAKASRFSLEKLISWNQRFNLALLKRFLTQENVKEEVKKLLSGTTETLSQWENQNPDSSLSLYALSQGTERAPEALTGKKRTRDEAFPQ